MICHESLADYLFARWFWQHRDLGIDEPAARMIFRAGCEEMTAALEQYPVEAHECPQS